MTTIKINGKKVNKREYVDEVFYEKIECDRDNVEIECENIAEIECENNCKIHCLNGADISCEDNCNIDCGSNCIIICGSNCKINCNENCRITCLGEKPSKITCRESCEIEGVSGSKVICYYENKRYDYVFDKNKVVEFREGKFSERESNRYKNRINKTDIKTE